MQPMMSHNPVCWLIKMASDGAVQSSKLIYTQFFFFFNMWFNFWGLPWLFLKLNSVCFRSLHVMLGKQPGAFIQKCCQASQWLSAQEGNCLFGHTFKCLGQLSDMCVWARVRPLVAVSKLKSQSIDAWLSKSPMAKSHSHLLPLRHPPFLSITNVLPKIKG